MHYAALNLRADARNHADGFLNTWSIARFKTKAGRSAFLDKESNRMAKAVSRTEAAEIFANTYLCIGEPVPRGGLFGDNPMGSNFHGE